MDVVCRCSRLDTHGNERCGVSGFGLSWSLVGMRGLGLGILDSGVCSMLLGIRGFAEWREGGARGANTRAWTRESMVHLRLMRDARALFVSIILRLWAARLLTEACSRHPHHVEGLCRHPKFLDPKPQSRLVAGLCRQPLVGVPVAGPQGPHEGCRRCLLC